MWCDLNMDMGDFDALTQIISAASQGQFRLLCEFAKKYPVCLTAHAVFQNQFGEDDEFWEPWGTRLGVPISTPNQNRIGQIFLDTFSRLGYSTDCGSGHKYVTPLRNQAGLPSYCLKDVFALAAAEPDGFDPICLAEELATSKSYLVNIPVSRLAASDLGRMVEYLLEIQRGLLQNGRQPEGSHAYIAEELDHWRKKNLGNAHTGSGKKASAANPRLCCMGDGRGLCIVLPPYGSNCVSVYAESITWAIISGGEKKQYLCRLRRSGEANLSREIMVSVPLQSEYLISVSDDIHPSTTIREWKIPGINEVCAVFRRDGSPVPPAHLPVGGGYLLFKREMVPEVQNATLTEIPVPDHLRGMTCNILTDVGPNACIRFSQHQANVELRVKTSVSMYITGTGTLFGEPEHPDEITVYTSFPALRLVSPMARQTQCQVVVLQNALGKNWTLPAQVLEAETGTADISPETLLNGMDQVYGIYTIKVYAEARIQCVQSFCYMPEVEYDGREVNPWPTELGRWRPSRLRFLETPELRIIPDEEFLLETEQSDDLLWHVVALQGGRETIIRGTISYTCEQYAVQTRFRKTLRHLMWRFWDADRDVMYENFNRFNHQEIQKGKMLLSLAFTDGLAPDHADLVLCHGSSTLNRYSIPQRVAGVFSLNNLCVGLGPCDFPVSLELRMGEKGCGERAVRLAWIRETVILTNLRYLCNDRTKGKPLLIWDAASEASVGPVRLISIADPDFNMIFDPGKATLMDNEKYIRRIKAPLPDGVYRISDAPRAETDNLFEEEEPGFAPIPLSGENFLRVNPERMLEKAYAPFDLLGVALCNFDRPEIVESCAAKLAEQGEMAGFQLGECGIKLLAAGAVHCMALEKSDTKSCAAAFGRIVDLYGRELLTGSMRARISLALKSMDLSADEFNFIFRRLNLFLFETRDIPLSEVTEEFLRFTGEHNRLLEVLWRMRTEKCRNVAAMLVSVIGTEAAKQMLRIHPKPACQAPDWYECLQKNLDGTCACMELSISPQIAGSAEEFSAMQVWIKNAPPTLDWEKAPTHPISFCGASYNDILVAWFRATGRTADQNRIRECQAAAQRNLSALKKVISSLGEPAGEICRTFMASFHARKGEGIHGLFYNTAAAAVLTAMGSHELISPEACQPAIQHLTHMLYVAPELVKRDLLLAEMFLFTQRRALYGHGSYSHA